jgi:hypothetical protein
VFQSISRNQVAFARLAIHVINRVVLARSLDSAKSEYICADQTVTLIFRLRQDGGPYIPDDRQCSMRERRASVTSKLALKLRLRSSGVQGRR